MNRPHHRFSFVALIALSSVPALLPAAPRKQGAPDDTRAVNMNFASNGLQPGYKIPDITVYTLDGKPRKLIETGDKPIMLVTSSLTCPVACRQDPSAEKLAKRFEGKIDVLVLYTIEAHPVTDPSPYRGVEWVTPANQQAGILKRQPTTIEERLKLANEFHDRFGFTLSIVVDNMDNTGWKALGFGPNMAILLTKDCTIVTKQSWLQAPALADAIERLLAGNLQPPTTQPTSK